MKVLVVDVGGTHVEDPCYRTKTNLGNFPPGPR